MAVNRPPPHQEANINAVTHITARLNSLPLTPPFPRRLPTLHLQQIIADYGNLHAANHLYQSQPIAFDASWTGVVVQVNTKYEGTHGDTNNPTHYRIDCMLNVDNMPEGNAQPPHIGWELQLNGKRVEKGHEYLDRQYLKAGRQKPGKGENKVELMIDKPEGNVWLQGLENNGQILRTCEVKRYRY